MSKTACAWMARIAEQRSAMILAYGPSKLMALSQGGLKELNYCFVFFVCFAGGS